MNRDSAAPACAAVRPFRYYRRLIDPTTRKSYLVIAHSRDLSRDASKDDGAIAEATVADWASELPVRLNADDLRKLCWSLNVMRVTAHVEDVPGHPELRELRGLRDAHRQVDGAMHELSKLSPELSTLIDVHRRLGDDAAASVFESIVATTARYFDVRLAVWAGVHGKPWHRDAVYLMTLLEDAGDRKPRTLGGFTKEESPAVKFIHKALRRAGVDHGRPGSIARALARYNARVQRV